MRSEQSIRRRQIADARNEIDSMLLSICIATYNRAGFIGQTLDTIIPQLRPGVEVVIVDGASPDNTSAVVSAYVERHPSIRYFREERNSGFDRDLDKSVAYAMGDHCWLLSDDDFVQPSAIDRVLSALEDGSVDVLVVEHETIDASLKRKLPTIQLPFRGERIFQPQDSDGLLASAALMTSFIGSTIIRKQLWLTRNRERYFDSMFVHVGVIFQSPAIARVKLLAESLVVARAGNAMWRPRAVDIWGFRWPALIWSFEGYSDEAKRRVTPREPWKTLRWLLLVRAMGAYSNVEYEKYFSDIQVGPWRLMLSFISIFPGRLANFITVCVAALLGRGDSEFVYELVASSRFSNPMSRFLAGFWLGALALPARRVVTL